MASACFVAGDWGTSQLRLTLCDAAGAPLAAQTGPGVAALDRRLAETFRHAVGAWDAAHGLLPLVLCGMAGSTLGWREVPYLPCPADPEAIAAGALRFEDAGRPIAIAPGLSCTNPLQSPDVMRGEETQILGALHLDRGLAAGVQLLCLPGTHTKWVLLEDGVIVHFLTSLSGEVFDVLSRHSVLVGKTAQEPSTEVFAHALAQAGNRTEGDLLQLLFQVRSRQLTGDVPARHAAEFLSGLIVGRDAASAVRLFEAEIARAAGVTIIGAPALATRYALALDRHGIAARCVSGDEASLTGLLVLHDALRRQGWPRVI